MKSKTSTNRLMLCSIVMLLILHLEIAFGQNVPLHDYEFQKNMANAQQTASIAVRQMFFIDSTTGWVVGEKGLIVKTTTSGVQWTQENLATQNNVYYVFFVSKNIGWICGQYGMIQKTTDGGNTWIPQASGTNNDLLSVYFANPNQGWIAVADSGIILSTQNGGEIWTRQTSGVNVQLRNTVFTNTNYGWMCGANGTIIHTTNGGINWTSQNTFTTTYLWWIDFTDSLHGFVAGGSWTDNSTIFLKTTDGGSTWLSQMPASASLFGTDFMNADTGWVVGRSGTILKTTNGGNSWISQNYNGLWLAQVCFMTNKIGYALTGPHTLLCTIDGGSSWNTRDITVTSPPIVVSFTPLRNALNITKNTTITVTFDTDISPTTLTNSTIRVNRSLSGLNSCTFNYNTETRTATITPDTQFKTGELVTVTLTRGIKDANGDSLQTSCSWSFTIKTNISSGLYCQSSTAGVGNTPWYLSAADFNGDSAIDLAVVNNYSDDVSILKNNGQGIFSKTSTVNVGSYPGSITTADLDCDGDMDLAVSNSGSNTVSILKNDGHGIFTQTSTVTVVDYPWNVAAADLDGDGMIDLAVTNTSGTIFILKNNGNGSFTETSSIRVGSNVAYSVTAADFNSDGAIDLVTTNFHSNTISILINNGNGIFTETSTVDVGNAPLAAAAADLNGDGAIDLAVANLYSNTISILKNNGNGIFTLTSTVNTGNSPTSVIAVDADGNGVLDLAVVNAGSGSVSILKNNGSGSFTPMSTVSTGIGSSPRIVTAADLDGNGKIDLAVVNLGLNSVSILTVQQTTPHTISITDVPNDNGKQVFIQWTTHGSPIDSGVTNFSIYRYDQQAWTYIKDVPVLSDSVYQTIVPTLYDSTIAQGMFWSVFKVLARTADPSVYKTIGPDSGYSVDNLPPLAPTNGIAIRLSNGNIFIQWRAALNIHGDFKEYVLYRSTQSDFVPSPATRIAFVQDTVYTDLTTQGNIFYYKTTSKDYAGNESQPLVIATSTSIELINSQVPQRTCLAQNYPNPFNPSTQIQFSIAKAGYVTLKVFDLSGQEVASLISREMTPGTYAVPFSAANLSSGMYFYRLQAGIFSSTKKMLLIK